MKAIRAFFALTLPQSTVEALQPTLVQLRKTFPQDAVRWTPLANLHITLQFLQQVQAQDLEQLIANVRLELQEAPSLDIDFGAIKFFPSAKSPRVIAMQVGPQVSLAALAQKVGQGIIASNYPVEARAFRGHLTLGRLAKTKNSTNLLEAIKIPRIPNIEIKELNLLASQQTGAGSLYTPLAQFILKNNLIDKTKS